MSAKDDSSGSTCGSIVTQMYTFSSWSKQKAITNGYASSSMLPYVGFPGLSLTPIPENPLLDPSHNEDTLTASERDRWLAAYDEADLLQHKHTHRNNGHRNGSIPKHWLINGAVESPTIEEIENGGKDCADGKSPSSSPSKSSSSSSCATTAVNVHVVHTTTFLPKDEPMTREEKRTHTCKLLLLALCGFVMIAAIVLWIFSPAFT